MLTALFVIITMHDREMKFSDYGMVLLFVGRYHGINI